MAKVLAERDGWALVRKFRDRWGKVVYWSKARWVPSENIAREATPREATLGHPIDPVPPRLTSAAERGTGQ